MQGSIWKNRTFVKLFSAYSLSTFGDWFDAIAMVVLMSYVWRVEPMVLSLIPLTFALPSILLSQVAGVFVDRWKKLDVMLVSDLLQAVITGLLILAPGPYTALGLLTLRALSGVFNVPAQQSLTREVVAEEHLLKATSLNGLVASMSKVVGPLLGAAVIAVAAPQVCLMLNAVSFLLSAVLLLWTRLTGELKESTPHLSEQNEKQDAPTFSEQWREGFVVLFGNRMVLPTLLFSLTGFIAIQFVDFQFSTVFREVAPDLYQLSGWYMAVIGAGSVCSIAYMNRLKSIERYGLVMAVGIFFLGVLIGSAGMMKPGMSLVWPMVGAFVGGIGNGMVMIGLNYLLQKETPKDKMGRVVGIMESIRSAVFIAAPLLGGVIVEAVGPMPTFQIIGAVLLALGIAGFLLQNVIWKRPQPKTVVPVAPIGAHGMKKEPLA